MSAESGFAIVEEAALRRVHGVTPVWRGVEIASDAMEFPHRTILHAGPPIRGEIARPMLNSAIMAAMMEGWATTPDAAEAMLLAGEIKLAPAQDHGAMVPLAAVLSPGMFAHVVVDANDPRNRCLSPINGGMKFAQRLGMANPQTLAHLRWMNGNLAATLSIIADKDIPLIEVADAAMVEGDDCHARTADATRILVDALAPRLGTDTLERRFLNAAPGFFLNVWMAAVRCIAKAGEGPDSDLVTAMGGNGMEVGIQVGALPGRWFVASAEPPVGTLLEGFADADRLGAIGDSALVDALGFGSMLAVAASGQHAEALISVRHPAFKRHPTAVGLSASRVVQTGRAPSVALGILDKSGRRGRLGGGIYTPPPAIFAEAGRGWSDPQKQGEHPC